MKKYFTKPVIAALAVVAIAGGLTPVWASNSTTSSTSDDKVVMNDDIQENTRYRLKDLLEINPDALNLLLKTKADSLYVVVDEINLDEKLSTYMEEHADEWEQIYKDHYADIYLEVRLNDQDGFVSLNQETKDNTIYITGKVSSDVDKVVINTPNNGKIEVFSFVDGTFKVTVPAVVGSTAQYVTLQAYDADKLLDTEKLRINEGTVVDEDVLVHASAAYYKNTNKVKVLGVVNSSADEVYVTYAGEKKKASLKKVWSGTEAFFVEFEMKDSTAKEALVEVYVDGKQVDSSKTEVTNLNVSDVVKPATYTVKGTATISPKNKLVTVKGTVEGADSLDLTKYKLFAIAPDGVKYQIQLQDKNQFEANLSFKNRSFSAKGVTIQLFDGDKLIYQTVIPHGVPVNVVPVTSKTIAQPVKVEFEVKKLKEDWKNKGKGKLKGEKENDQGEDQDDDHDKEKDHGKGHGNGHK